MSVIRGWGPVSLEWVPRRTFIVTRSTTRPSRTLRITRIYPALIIFTQGHGIPNILSITLYSHLWNMRSLLKIRTQGNYISSVFFCMYSLAFYRTLGTVLKYSASSQAYPLRDCFHSFSSAFFNNCFYPWVFVCSSWTWGVY